MLSRTCTACRAGAAWAGQFEAGTLQLSCCAQEPSVGPAGAAPSASEGEIWLRKEAQSVLAGILYFGVK